MFKKIISALTVIFTCAVLLLNVAPLASALTAKPIDNKQGYVYNRCASVIDSYLYEESGELIRVDCDYANNALLVEKTDIDGVLKEQLSVPLVFPEKVDGEDYLFGGFFAGKNENYVVVGQTNSIESDDTEVLAVTKYSKNWEVLSTCRIKGINTTVPFDAGSLRMDETDDFLYIHTCHEMYTSGDGLNHQANMTFKISKSDMTVSSSYSGVMNISYGYVSHSFNQFVKTDGDYVYRADHGDAYPRSIVLTKTAVSSGSVTDVEKTAEPVSFNGKTGNNTTGASLGGLEISSKNCIVVGNIADLWSQEEFSSYMQRNVFVGIVNKDTFECEPLKYLTNYDATSDSDTVTVIGTPKIVKCGEDRFAIMWNEWAPGVSGVYGGWNKTFLGGAVLCYTVIDGEGNVVSPTRRNAHCAVSACQPVFTSDSKITWVYSDYANVKYFKIDPYNDTVIEHSPADAVEENRIEATCSKEGSYDSVVYCYVCGAEISREQKTISAADDNVVSDTNDFDNFTNNSFFLGDVDGDGSVTVGDARKVLRFAVGLEVPTTAEALAADYDTSDTIDVSDARMILRVAVGLEQLISITMFI